MHTFLINRPTAINKKPVIMSLCLFFTLLKLFTEIIKNGKYLLRKMIRSHYIVVLSKSLKRPGNSFQSSQQS